MTLRHQILDLPLDRIEAEVSLAPFFVETRPLSGPAALLDWRLNGLLTEMLVKGSTAGDFGEAVVFRNNHKIASDWTFFVGGGARPPADSAGASRLLSMMLAQAVSAGFHRIALALPAMTASDHAFWGEVMVPLCAGLPTGVDCFFSLPSPTHRGPNAGYRGNS